MITAFFNDVMDITKTVKTNVDTSWTVDGKKFVKRKSDGRRFQVANQSDFTNMNSCELNLYVFLLSNDEIFSGAGLCLF